MKKKVRMVLSKPLPRKPRIVLDKPLSSERKVKVVKEKTPGFDLPPVDIVRCPTCQGVFDYDLECVYDRLWQMLLYNFPQEIQPLCLAIEKELRLRSIMKKMMRRR